MLLPLALAACAPVAPATDGPASDVVFARLGETARLGDITVRPVAVAEDSRCPRDATCVWAGRLRLRAAIAGVAGEPELTLGEAYRLRSGTLTLVSAMPERWQDPPPGTEHGPANRFGFRRD